VWLADVLQDLHLPISITLTPPKASDELTARMHCAIRCIARQMEWAGRKLSEEEWKRLLVAGHFGQRVLPSPYGDTFVVIDQQTRNLSGPQKHDFVESIYEFGARNGVVFDD
jgi:hypothetical protein